MTWLVGVGTDCTQRFLFLSLVSIRCIRGIVYQWYILGDDTQYIEQIHLINK